MPVELGDSYESLLNRAVQQMALGKSQDAIDLVLRVVNRLSELSVETLARRPGHRALLMNAWEMSTEFLRWEKRFDEAIAVCERLIASHPDLDNVHLRVNMLRIERGEVEQGLAGLRQAAERVDRAYGWTVLGIQLCEMGEVDQSEVYLKKALARSESNETSADVYMELFTLYKSQHRLAEALEAWDMAAVLQPGRTEDTYVLYRWLIQEGEIERAQSYLRRERNPLRTEFYTGLIDWHAGQFDRARHHWQAAWNVEVGEDDPALIEWLEAALRLGETDTLIAEFERRLTNGELLSPFALMIGALAYALIDDMTLAHGTLRDAVRILERRWPSRSRIEGWWPLVTEVISNSETLSALAVYFEQNEARR